MTRDRFAVLDDVDQLLGEIDDEMITESLERGESPDHGVLGDPMCDGCGHDWHGLSCEGPQEMYGCNCDVCMDARGGCGCESSLARLDDTWRPRLSGPHVRAHELMHYEGLDGWAALAQVEIDDRETVRRNRERFGRAGIAAPDAALRIPAGVITARALDTGGWVRLGMLNAAQGVTFEYAGDGAVYVPDPPAPSRSGGSVTFSLVDEVDWEAQRAAIARAFDRMTTTWEAMRPTFEAFGRQANEAARTIRESMTGLADSMHLHFDLSPDRPPPPPIDLRAADPRAYALQLRQSRNTGPDRPSGQRAHRPRRHQ